MTVKYKQPQRKSEGLVFWLTIIAVCLLSLIASQARPAEGPTNLAPYKSICQINTSAGQGSGTLVGVREDYNLGLVLSCRHVCTHVGNQLKFSWLWAGGAVTAGETIAVIKGGGFDTDKALAVCKLPKGVRPLAVKLFNPSEAPFVAAGFRDNTMRISGPTYNINAAPNGLLVIDEPFIGGMSGGPLFDRQGRVIGVVVASDGRIGVSSNGPQLVQLVQAFLVAKTVKECLEVGK